MLWLYWVEKRYRSTDVHLTEVSGQCYITLTLAYKNTKEHHMVALFSVVELQLYLSVKLHQRVTTQQFSALLYLSTNVVKTISPPRHCITRKLGGKNLLNT